MTNKKNNHVSLIREANSLNIALIRKFENEINLAILNKDTELLNQCLLKTPAQCPTNLLLNTVKTLIKAGADVYTVKDNHNILTELLIKLSWHKEDVKTYPLILETLTYLVKNEIYINQTYNCDTPLVFAISRNDKDLINVLLKLGGDINQQFNNNQRLSCSKVAINYIHTAADLLEYLIEKGLDLTITDEDGKNVLEYIDSYLSSFDQQESYNSKLIILEKVLITIANSNQFDMEHIKSFWDEVNIYPTPETNNIYTRIETKILKNISSNQKVTKKMIL